MNNISSATKLLLPGAITLFLVVYLMFQCYIEHLYQSELDLSHFVQHSLKTADALVHGHITTTGFQSTNRTNSPPPHHRSEKSQSPSKIPPRESLHRSQSDSHISPTSPSRRWNN